VNHSKGDTMRNFRHPLRRGTTFALLLFGLLAILAPDPASAQLLVGKAGTYASLPPCSLDPIHNSAGRFAVLSDATIAAGVVTGGSGSPAIAWCPLDGSDWRALAVPVASASGLVVTPVQSVTCTDSGDGSAGALTLLPTANFVQITNADAHGCAVTLSETGMVAGTEITVEIVSSAGGTVDFADTSGVTELSGALTLGLYDTLRLAYSTSRWAMLGTSNN
jgi:hypothetical protein